MKYALRASAAGALLMVALSACGGSSAAPAPTATPTAGAPAPTVGIVRSTPVPARDFVAGLVTDVGGLGDRSFNDLAWAGIKAAEQQYGIRGRVLQSRTEADYPRYLTAMARAHVSLIVAVGASMGQAVYSVAARFPRQHFALIDARPLNAAGQEVPILNVADVLFDSEQSGYLAGVLAGTLARDHVGAARHNTIGYLGGMAIPQVDRYLAGYVAGAKQVDPGVKIVGQYAHTFSNPGRGRSIASSQIDKGADVLFQVAASTGTGYIQAAGARHVYAIGVDADQSYLGPQVVASAVKRVNVAIRKLLHRALQGSFLPGDNIFGAANGGTDLAIVPAHVPPAVRAQVTAYGRKLANGTVVAPVALPVR